MSMREFQNYLNNQKIQLDVHGKIVPQMRSLMYDSVRASHDKLNPNKRPGCFEILGYDFMVDTDHKVWLIEINTNSCLDTSCTLLATVVPSMLEVAICKIAK